MPQRVKQWTRWGGSLSVSMTGSGTVSMGQSVTGSASLSASIGAAFAGSGTAYEAGAALVAGETATATGTGFGSTGPTIRAIDSFEGGTNGNAVSSPEYGSYANAEVTYSNTSPHSGTLCAKSEPSGADQYKPIDVAMNVGTGQYYFLSVWMKWTSGPDGGQLKIFQQWGEPSSPTTYGPGWFTSDLTGWQKTDYVDDSSYVDYDNHSYATNTWHHFEFLARQDSPAGASNGFIQVRINGSLSGNYSGPTRDSGSSRIWGEMHIADGHTNASSTYTTYYIDEVYATLGCQRVVLSDSATPYAGLMVPQRIVSWSDTSIQYTVFPGALSSGTVYEHVYDASNTKVQTTERTLA